MRAVGVIPNQKQVTLLEHQTPTITSDTQVKIKTLDVGICGTDREICTFVYGQPPTGSDYLVLGHESLGVVVEVGSKVNSVKVGDLVSPSVRRPCHHLDCQPCQTGLQDFCTKGDFVERGIKMMHGYMTEYFVEEQSFLFPVPPELRDVAVLIEPLTIAEKALEQVWQIQSRLPWTHPNSSRLAQGAGLNAVVLGAGPIGILGAMTLVANGFNTYVYSRSKGPNPKSELVESFGAKYISSLDESASAFAERVGRIDFVYEALGIASVSFEIMEHLALNGIFVFTGIPAPEGELSIPTNQLMRNWVLKNQAIIGTVNASPESFRSAIRDLGTFNQLWPDALRKIITKRYRAEDYQELLIGKSKGIKNVIAFD